jgi:hypothetical protein
MQPMTKFLSIISILVIALNSCGQTYKEYHFAGIGLNIKIPDGYIIQDTFPAHKYLDVNNQPITDSIKISKLDSDLFKGLLIASTQDQNNTISFDIALETPKTGDIENYYNFSKNIQQLMAKQQMVDYDTTSSILNVDNVEILKFLTYSVQTKPIQYNAIYIAKVKKYFLIIKADYKDKAFGDAFDKAILSSNFD